MRTISKESLQQAPGTIGRFIVYFVNNFNQQHGLQTASSLAYTTLLSLVPLITVMFALLEKLSIQDNFSEAIQEFVFTNFVPEVGSTVLEYISGFSDKASQLTLTGIILLIIIALMLMVTIDNAINRIWTARKGRKMHARLVTYFLILILGPLLIGYGLASTSYLLSLPFISDVDSSLQLQARMLKWLPYLSTSLAFTLVYILVPNYRISRLDALLSGIFSASLFEVAKTSFGLYVKTMTGYQSIYGAIAVIPLFLIWVYVSWVIILAGAHLTFCLSTFRENEA